MQTIYESKKQELPVMLVTDFIAKGWSQIGLLKDQIKVFSKEFKDAKAITDSLQALVDSYLICVGQLSAYLDKQHDLNPQAAAQALREDVSQKQVVHDLSALLVDQTQAVRGYTNAIHRLEQPSQTKDVLKHISDEELQHIDQLTALLAKSGQNADVDHAADQENASTTAEPFEYFVDFDEPDDTGLTDEQKRIITQGLKASW